MPKTVTEKSLFDFDWLYQLPIPVVAVSVIVTTVSLAIGAFEIARLTLLYRFKSHDGINDAISGALGAIGVFYGITVGLIAIDVWQRHTEAESIVTREAAAIHGLYLMVRPETNIGRSVIPTDVFSNEDLIDLRKSPAQLIGEYLMEVICVSWNEQQAGTVPRSDRLKLRIIRAKLQSFQPENDGQVVRYAAAVNALNTLSELRRFRVDATNDRLSGALWMIILCGAVMSMCVVFLFKLEDVNLHRLTVGLLSGFLGFVLLMIILNNRPFFGKSSVEPDSLVDIAWIARPTTPTTGEQGFSKRTRQDREALCRGR